MPTPLRIRSAFTLIELLVVVAIITILLAILLPSLGRARSVARQTYCLNNLKQWSLGYVLYADSFNDMLPYTGASDGNSAANSIGFWGDSYYWANAVPLMLNSSGKGYNDLQNDDLAGIKPLPNIGSKSIFVCPEVMTVAAGVGDSPLSNGCFMMWGKDASANVVQRRVFWCYVTNSKIDNSIQASDGLGHPTLKRTAIRANWSLVPYMVEKMMNPGEISPPYGSSIARGKTTFTRLAGRHKAGGNIAFVDGHAEWFSYADLSQAPPGPDNDNSIPGKIVWDPFNAGWGY